MDIKKKITISGQKVHDVGYRVLLTNKALSCGVNNFNTFNTYLNGTQAVIAIIEAEVTVDGSTFVPLNLDGTSQMESESYFR